MSKKFITSIEVTLPSDGKLLKIHKLKAGKYYQAQKIYAEWILSLQKLIVSGKDIGKDKLSEQELEKITTTLDIDKMLKNSEQINKKRLELLEICLDKSLSEIEQDYYPEDLSTILEGVIRVNNFTDNLKKSVAPMQETVGADKED